jgi:hypothetical protein
VPVIMVTIMIITMIVTTVAFASIARVLDPGRYPASAPFP